MGLHRLKPAARCGAVSKDRDPRDKRGVRCNAVKPGSIQTSMMGPDVMPESVDMKLVMRAQPLDESRPPEVVAAVIAMLASEDGAHINGEEIRVDGGTLA